MFNSFHMELDQKEVQIKKKMLIYNEFVTVIIK